MQSCIYKLSGIIFSCKFFLLYRYIIFMKDWTNGPLTPSFSEVCAIISCYYDAILIGKNNGQK